MTSEALTRTLLDCFISPDVADGNLEPANLVDVVQRVAEGAHHVARALEKLGVADASTGMGAIEVLAREVRDAGSAISDGLHAIADAVSKR
jgi:hypothetical protein